jgi:hypothetical protein
MEPAARRTLLGGVLAGGLLTAGAAPSVAATFTARQLPVRKLKPGDLIVGPRSTLVRVASRAKLSGGRFRVRYTHPHTGAATAMTPALDAEGYAAGHRFVVLLRGVAVDAVRLTPVPAPTDPNVIDGGTP